MDLAVGAIELPARRLRVEPVLAAALAVALAVYAAGWGVLRVTPGDTGLRTVAWYGPVGERLPPLRRAWAGCGDERFRGVIAGERLWVRCAAGPGFPAGGFARIDPARGRADVRWPFPLEHGEPLHILAFAPGPGGRFAIAYRVYGGRVVAGVAGERGWEIAPETVPGQDVGSIVWDGEVAQVAMLPLPWIVRLGGDARAIGQLDVDDVWYDASAGRWTWRFFGDAREARPTPAERGVIEPTFGAMEAYPLATDFGGDVTGYGLWIARARGVARSGLRADEADDTWVQPAAGATWRLHVDGDGRAPWPLEVQRDDGPWRQVARIAATGQPALIAIPGGGVRIVFDDGEHLAITDDGARADPLSLAGHLHGQTWRARLVQTGLPIALLLALVVARVRRRRAAPALLVAAATYAIAGTLCLVRLAPLL